MIEFTLSRARNGKKSRWAKKYPRKRILMFNLLSYMHNLIPKTFQVGENCTIYVKKLRGHTVDNFLVHSISQMVIIVGRRLQYM